MAGGMSKRGSWGPMTDLLAATARNAQPDAGPSEPAPSAHLKHVWVMDRHGRLPGLLLAWRQLDTAGWEGRVAHLVLASDGRWDLVEEWLPAGLLGPA